MLNSSIWRAVLSLFYPPVIIQGKNGKNSESPVGSNKSEKRKPKSAVYRSILASVVYFHIRLISTRRHKREMTRNQFDGNVTWVRIPSSPPMEPLKTQCFQGFFLFVKNSPTLIFLLFRCIFELILCSFLPVNIRIKNLPIPHEIRLFKSCIFFAALE